LTLKKLYGRCYWFFFELSTHLFLHRKIFTPFNDMHFFLNLYESSTPVKETICWGIKIAKIPSGLPREKTRYFTLTFFSFSNKLQNFVELIWRKIKSHSKKFTLKKVHSQKTSPKEFEQTFLTLRQALLRKDFQVYPWFAFTHLASLILKRINWRTNVFFLLNVKWYFES